MRLVLIGADFEENLGIGMIAAAAEAAGHSVTVVPFNDSAQGPAIAARVAALAPDAVGLGIQFQHRAHEFLSLARCLRSAGFRGHLTCGGQFPTLAWQEVLQPSHGLDSVVLHEGEHTITELLAALGNHAPMESVPGLAVRDVRGAPLRTAPRGLVENLDQLPFARRYRPHTRHLGIPFIPLMASRGCWGACTYCSITSFYRDAREYGGGKTLRARSPRNVAAEMAVLWHAAGGAGIFCFHDDNMLLPRPADTLVRLREIRAELDALEVGRIGLIGKCRPETVTPSLAVELRKLGVLRLYVGVENASERGADHLNRAKQSRSIRDALHACREAGIFVCYNLLLFEPDATLDDVAENIAFVREHAEHPVNFCRAEPYYGTPLHLDLAARSGLGGSYLGWNYRIGDDRSELLFRICAAAFRQRNFAADGVANRYMGVGYSMKVLEHFHDPDVRLLRLAERAAALTRAVSLDSADHLEQALRLAQGADLSDRDSVVRQTALLGLRIASVDRVFHERLDDLYADMNRYAESARAPRVRPLVPRRLKQLATSMMLGVSLAAWGAGCGDDSTPGPVDRPPRDAGWDVQVADPPPRDAGVDVSAVDPAPVDAGRDVLVADPPPRDAGMDVFAVDPAPFDAGRDVMVADPPPRDAGVDVLVADPAPFDAGRDVMVVDPPPPPMDGGVVVDPPPRDAGIAAPAHDRATPARLPLIDQWRDSTPRQARRSEDLPLHDPPAITVTATRTNGRVHVRLGGIDAERVSIRWEADGDLDGAGLETDWTPRSDSDQLRIAVRSRGGVAVTALRASDIH